jgi:hypothetical protein
MYQLYPERYPGELFWLLPVKDEYLLNVNIVTGTK